MALVIQVGPQYDSYGDRRGGGRPARWKKKMEGDPSRNRSSDYPAGLLTEMNYGDSLAPRFGATGNDVRGSRGLRHFVGAVVGKEVAGYRPKPRWQANQPALG